MRIANAAGTPQSLLAQTLFVVPSEVRSDEAVDTLVPIRTPIPVPSWSLRLQHRHIHHEGQVNLDGKLGNAPPLDLASSIYWRKLLKDFTAKLVTAIRADPDRWLAYLEEQRSLPNERRDSVLRFFDQIGLKIEMSLLHDRVEIDVPPLEEVLTRYDRVQLRALISEVTAKGDFEGYRLIRPRADPRSPGRILFREFGSSIEAPAVEPSLWSDIHVGVLQAPGGVIDPEVIRHFGGITHYIRNKAIELARLGAQVDLISMASKASVQPGIKHFPELPNLRLIRIDVGAEQVVTPFNAFPVLPRWVEGILDLYSGEGGFPDCWSAHGWQAGYSARLLRKETGIPYTYQAHVLTAKQWPKVPLDLRLAAASEGDPVLNSEKEPIAVAHAGAVFVNSLHEADAYDPLIWSDEGPRNLGFQVAEPGVDPSIFHPSPQPDEIRKDIWMEGRIKVAMASQGISDPSPPWVVITNALNLFKNAEAVLRAFAVDEALRKRANVVCMLDLGLSDHLPLREQLGSLAPARRASLERLLHLIEELGLKEKVLVLSIVNRTRQQLELASLLRVAAKRGSVYVNASWMELYGMSIIEAMACGLPVLCTRESPFGGESTSCRSIQETRTRSRRLLANCWATSIDPTCGASLERRESSTLER